MDARRKKLLYQSQHCGMKENDILLGTFADACIGEMSTADLDLFEALMGENDHDIYAWITAQQPLAPQVDHRVMAALISFHDDRQASS